MEQTVKYLALEQDTSSRDSAERKYSNQILQDAKQLIDDFLPQERTDIPTKLLNLRNCSEFAAVYLGEVNNQEYIAFSLNHEIHEQNTPMNLKEYMDEKNDQYTLAHELIHQRHAQVIGLDILLGEGKVIIEGIDEMSSEELRELILEEEHIPPRTMSTYVTESIAVMGVLYLMKKDEERLRIQGKLMEAEAVSLLRRKELRDLRATVRKVISGCHPSQADGSEYFVSVFALMRGLQKRFGIEALPNIVRKIDMQACLDIPEASEKFWEILDDPLLLPGLEELKAL